MQEQRFHTGHGTPLRLVRNLWPAQILTALHLTAFVICWCLNLSCGQKHVCMCVRAPVCVCVGAWVRVRVSVCVHTRVRSRARTPGMFTDMQGETDETTHTSMD